MTDSMILLACMGGTLLGILAWVPLAMMFTKVPRAGAPLKIKLTADAAQYVQAMKDARNARRHD